MATTEYFHQYYLDHIDKLKLQNKELYIATREKTKEKRDANSKRHYKNNKEYYKEYQKKYNQRLRDQALNLLGGKCASCGIDDKRVLQFDHIYGGGQRDRRSVKGLYISTVLKSIKANENKFQLLCANCNWIKKYDNNENIKLI